MPLRKQGSYEACSCQCAQKKQISRADGKNEVAYAASFNRNVSNSPIVGGYMEGDQDERREKCVNVSARPPSARGAVKERAR